MITGKLETLVDDFRYIIKSAMPNLTEDKLIELEEKFSGGPRREWETRGSSSSSNLPKYADYYSLLTSHQIEDLQRIYKWDYILYNYNSNPLYDS